ncbi:MAG: hypothetical protein VX737_03870 [Pseudomonadota bacterium]|nr:hypothetical protein [Pseudomonadota bacterium]
MSVYTQKVLDRIQKYLKTLPQEDQSQFDLTLLNQLSTLIQQKSTLEETSEHIHSSNNQPNTSQQIQELEKQIDEKFAIPLYDYMEGLSDKSRRRPSNSLTMSFLYFSNLLAAIPFISTFFSELVKSQKKIKQSPQIDYALKHFLLLRSKSFSRQKLKQSIVTKLQDSQAIRQGEAPDIIDRVKALKYSRLGWEQLEEELSSTKIPRVWNRYIALRERSQRKYITDQVLKNSDPAIQEQLSDISHYEETLKHLASGYDIYEQDAVHFKVPNENQSSNIIARRKDGFLFTYEQDLVHFIGQDENEFLLSVLTKHRERQQQLASDMSEYSDQYQKFFSTVKNLETALAFSDPSQQMNFVDIMRETPSNQLRGRLTGYVESFNSDFLQTATQALIELNKTPGFSAAFAQASYKDRHQLILDYQLPHYIKQESHHFLTVDTYRNPYSIFDDPLPQDHISRINACFKDFAKANKLNSDEITKQLESRLPHLSLEELKELERLIFPQKRTHSKDYIPPSSKLAKKYFLINNKWDIESLCATANKIDFLMNQKDFLESLATTDTAKKPFYQQVAEQFIKDQGSLSQSTAHMDLTAPSFISRTIELQNNATQSTQQSLDKTRFDRPTHHDDHDVSPRDANQP